MNPTVDNNLLEVLANCHKGKTLNQASADLREVVAACMDTGKKGKLTITIDVIPRGDNQFEINPKIKSSKPQAVFGTALFFADDGNGLSRNDPNQAELPFKGTTVKAEAANG